MAAHAAHRRAAVASWLVLSRTGSAFGITPGRAGFGCTTAGLSAGRATERLGAPSALTRKNAANSATATIRLRINKQLPLGTSWP